MARTKQTSRKSAVKPARGAAHIGGAQPTTMEGGPSSSTAQSERPALAGFPMLDLDDRLLSHILSALGPEPCNLAAASLTCKRLHRIAQETAWKSLCYKLAPKTCDDVVPPGGVLPAGWQTLYKMFVWCPGFEPYMWWLEEIDDGDHDEELRPHVEKKVPRLSAERGRKFLRPHLQGDRLYLTKLACKHYEYSEEIVCAYRGFFRDFASSAMWADVKKEKVEEYVRKTAHKHQPPAQPIDKALAFTPLSGANPDKVRSLESGCPFCGVRMWDIGFGEGDWDRGHCLALNHASHYIILGAGFEFNPGDDPDGSDYEDREADAHLTMAYVCENGHLCGVFRGWYPGCYSDSEDEQEERGDGERSEDDHRPEKDPTVAVLANQKSWAGVRGALTRHYDRSYHMYLGL